MGEIVGDLGDVGCFWTNALDPRDGLVVGSISYLVDEAPMEAEPLPHETLYDVEREVMFDVEAALDGVDGTRGGGEDFRFKGVDIPFKVTAGIAEMLNGGKVSPIVALKREKLDVGCWIGDVKGEELGQKAAKTKKGFTFAWFGL